MIYACIPSFNEGPTVGLVLWKIRKVFEEFPREYQILVADDASTDQTTPLLDSYTKVLPLTLLRHPSQQGYARTVEELLSLALERTDRPKRDSGSGCVAVRLVTLRNALHASGRPLSGDGWAANAELIGRAAQHARRIETVPVVERHDLRQRESRIHPWETLRQTWRAAGRIRLERPDPQERKVS